MEDWVENFKNNLKEYYDNLPNRLPNDIDKERSQPFADMPTSSSFQEGRQLFGEGKDQESILSCNKAIEKDPALKDAYRIRAAAYRRLGKEQEARADIEHLINKGWYLSNKNIPWLERWHTVLLPNHIPSPNNPIKRLFWRPYKNRAFRINSRDIQIEHGPTILLYQLRGFKREDPVEDSRNKGEYLDSLSLEYLVEDGTLELLRFPILYPHWHWEKIYRDLLEACLTFQTGLVERDYEKEVKSFCSKWNPATLLRIGVDAHWTDIWYPKSTFSRVKRGQMELSGDNNIKRIVIERSLLEDSYGSGDSVEWSMWYEIPDLRIGFDFPNIKFWAREIRKIPVFGKVLGVDWSVELKASDRKLFTPFTTKVVDSLRRDEFLMQSLVDGKRVVEISVDNQKHCWHLSDRVFKHYDDRKYADAITSRTWNALAPTKRQMDCYEAIATVLLNTPISEKE